ETRPQPLEGDGRFRGESLHDGEVVVREDAGLVECRDGDHRGHTLLDEQRDECGARRPYPSREPRTDEARAPRVVDRERLRLEDRARDARRLALEVDADAAPPLEVHAVGAREVAGRLASVVGDEGEAGEADAEELGELVEQRPCDTLHVRAPRELLGDPADALELARRGGTPRFARPAPA